MQLLAHLPQLAGLTGLRLGNCCCMSELELAGSDKDHSRAVHFATFTYCGLCQIAAAVGDWATLGQWSGTGEELARTVGHQCELSEALAWQAVAAQQNGEGDKAGRALQNAQSHIARLKMPPKQGYYDAVALYHQHAGDLERALGVRDSELQTIADHGRLLYECRVRIKRLHLLAQLDRLQEKDLAAAREAARQLRCPDKYLAEVEQRTAT